MSNGHVCCILGVCCPPPGGREAQIESLAHILHEGGRESEQFIEWGDLAAKIRNRRVAQAAYLLNLFDFAPAGSLAPLIEALRPEFAKAAAHS